MLSKAERDESRGFYEPFVPCRFRSDILALLDDLDTLWEALEEAKKYMREAWGEKTLCPNLATCLKVLEEEK